MGTTDAREAALPELPDAKITNVYGYAAEQALYSLDAMAGEESGDRAKLLRACASTLRSAIAAHAPASEGAPATASKPDVRIYWHASMGWQVQWLKTQPNGGQSNFYFAAPPAPAGTPSARPLEWKQDSYGQWTDAHHGFSILLEEGDDLPYSAAWGEDDPEQFPTLQQAKAWCQQQLDAWVSRHVVVSAGTPRVLHSFSSIDCEKLIQATVPGGNVCDPQQVADNIRRYLDRWEPAGTPSEEARLRKALEFAEYMAKGADQFIRAVNDDGALRLRADEDGLGPGAEEQLHASAESVGEFMRGLRSDIYEFRKRAALATQEPKA